MLKYISTYLILLNFISFSQSDSTQSDLKGLRFEPRIPGGHIEATTLLYVTEFGGLVDVDLVNNKTEYPKSFGLRLGIEYYAYFEPGGPTGGGPFIDYSIYGRHTNRMKDLWLTILAGIDYHTYNKTYYYDDKVLFRTGLELKYNLLGNELGLLLKGSTSFQEQTSFFGFGIFIGYFE
jgi:hypothetical protein